ncbi:hypothetical protein J2Z40_000147 [Cytobacillus eiseniae]|uniref:DnaJ homologue subfamily C member 28 conserved domain-containing protein n=1 Tax=Cytobacillus eiseniae TaxID=762947 RepID=A0ABS4RB85_9BACI|nr:DnaJ family domain-containing protein [Cytobacillus eiseniae]MBP2239594.1 hypothetical protein [Cytobacillus eiseniae]
MEREYNDLIGDIMKQAGEKDNLQLKGMGKPLSKDYLQMDTFQHFQKIAKDAGYLPEWIKLQKEISQLVHSCSSEKDVEVINKRIKKYNKICPHQLQKAPISLEHLNKYKKVW